MFSFPVQRLRRTAFVLATIGVLLTTIGVFAPGVLAHAELERSSPAENAVLGSPPQSIELWMTEPVASGAGSPALNVLDESRNPLPISDLRVDPNDPRHITASVDGVGFGTYTVVWSVRSEVDGHTLNGTYAFRVGGTSRAPGAATVEGETPRVWAVVTRWTSFLGAAVAAAGFLIGPLVLGRAANDDPTAKRRFRLVLIGAVVGLLATLVEPFLQTRFPAAGTLAPSLGDAFAGLPDAWYLRAPGLLVASIVAAWLLVGGRHSGSLARAIGIAGAIAALLAVLGLALTSHASARESWRFAAIASVIIHQWSVALWTGGLIGLLVARPYDPDAEQRMPIQRFSRWALYLAVAGIVTGTINAGLILPTLGSLWESDYGKALIIKVILLVPALALATFHRATLRRAIERAAAAFRLSLRLETAIVALVVLIGSTLALLAPPSVAQSDVTSVDLAAELPGDSERYVRFVIEPADQGENDLSVSVTEGAPRSFDDTGMLVDAPVVDDVQLVRVELTNLLEQAPPIEVELHPDGNGWFDASDIQIGLEGWWRADVTVRQPGVEDASVPFYIVLPDPNVHGESAVRRPGTNEDAYQVFQTGLNSLLSLNSIHFVERLGGGTGTTLRSDHITHAGSQGQSAAMRIATEDSEIVRMEGSQWVRRTGQDWIKTDSNPVVPPSEWGTDYELATDFQLGGQEMVGGRLAQIITFYVPGDRLASAWYAWWVDDETGHLLRETMLSTGHYMVRDFDGFNSAPPITAPTT